ncbi:MAG: hypothetical protein ACSHW7_08620 [Patiriisocius sp.]|uniref:hypothetical protein n=1 Tax=Patiriisocius sp. TaxID=2822396 RepID=UPI003EF60AF1
MKTSNIITLIFLTIPIGIFGQNLECEDFREGSFFIESTMNGADIRFEMSRTGNNQIEYYGIDEALHLNLEWIDECTYIMKLDESKSDQDPASKFINENGGIYVTKKYIEKNCFYYTSNFKLPNDELVTIDGRICKEEI